MMATSTGRFAELLVDARGWDARHRAMADAQTEWLLEHFIIADTICSYATPIDRQKWDVPRVAGGYLYTKCD